MEIEAKVSPCAMRCVREPDEAKDDGWLLALNHQLVENRSPLVVFDECDPENGLRSEERHALLRGQLATVYV